MVQAALRGLASTQVIDQNVAHQLRGQSIELGATVQITYGGISQPYMTRCPAFAGLEENDFIPSLMSPSSRIPTNPRDPDIPSHEEVHRAWNVVNAELWNGFEKMSRSDWVQRHSAVSEEDFAVDASRNRFSILLSRTNHLSYHLGQAVLGLK